MLPPDIDYHVGPRRHMAFDALGPVRPGSMKLVRRRIVLRGMALQAKVVAFGSELEAVRFMAVTASYTGAEHPALDERAVFVHFVLDLPVGEVEVFVQQRDPIVVFYGLAMNIIFVEQLSPRMTSRAHLDFAL